MIIPSRAAVCVAAMVAAGLLQLGEAGDHAVLGRSVTEHTTTVSSPSVVGSGGTRLALGADGARTSEVVWNDNPDQFGHR